MRCIRILVVDFFKAPSRQWVGWTAYADVISRLLFSVTTSRIMHPWFSFDEDRRGQYRGKVVLVSFAFRASQLRHSTELGRGKDGHRTRPKGGSNAIKDFPTLTEGHGGDQRTTIGLPLMILRRSRR